MKLIPAEYRKHGLLSRWVVLKMMGQIFIEKKLISDIKEEQFGPILHILKYSSNEIDELINQINRSEYGLTS